MYAEDWILVASCGTRCRVRIKGAKKCNDRRTELRCARCEDWDSMLADGNVMAAIMGMHLWAIVISAMIHDMITDRYCVRACNTRMKGQDGGTMIMNYTQR